MDLWFQPECDFDKLFTATVNPKGVSPEVAKVRDELNNFKADLKPWLQEVGDSRKKKLEVFGEFLQNYVILDPNGKLAVSELNPIICNYIHKKTGLITETTSIKGYMETLYERTKSNDQQLPFWYHGNGGYFYRGIRWKTPAEMNH